MSTPKTTIDKVAVSKMAEQLAIMAARWAAESKYEDFADYIAHIKKHLPKGAKFVSLTKKPMTLRMLYAGQRCQSKVTRTHIVHSNY